MERRYACSLDIILWLFFFVIFSALFWNFANVFSMEWRCACGLGIILYFFSPILPCEFMSLFLHEMLSKCIDSGYLVGATPLTVFHWLFWNFADVFCMKWRYACGLGVILYFFSPILPCEFMSLFLHEILSKCIDSGYLVGATPLTVFHWLFWNFADVFCMKWRYACGLGVILYFFSHFFCFVNLVSFFFLHEMLSKCIDSGYLVGTTPLTVLHQLFWNFADVSCMEWCGFGMILGYFFYRSNFQLLINLFPQIAL